jgi:hypothetical protein
MYAYSEYIAKATISKLIRSDNLVTITSYINSHKRSIFMDKILPEFGGEYISWLVPCLTGKG